MSRSAPTAVSILFVCVFAILPVANAYGQPPSADVQYEQALQLLGRDEDQAFEHFQRLALAGHSGAMDMLAYLYWEGERQDRTLARQWWERAIAAGSPTAGVNLGRRLLSPPNHPEARRGFELLQSGHASRDPALRALAASGLGEAYLLGTGVAQDYARGVGFLREALAFDANDARANFLLGRSLESGAGVPENDEQALQHFRRAADRLPRAGWHAGMLMLEGVGGGVDEAGAYALIRQAAEDGDERAQISTGVMLAIGQGVSENDVEARTWYLRAARGGSAHGLRSLGAMLMTAEGGPADRIWGLAYLEMARDGGDEIAGQLIATLNEPVSGTERRAIDAAKAEWRTGVIPARQSDA